MRSLQMPPSNQSGQALLIAIGLGLLLVIGFGMIVHVNRIASAHQVADAQRTKNRSLAEEGLAYATQQLSVSSAIWQDALNGTFPAECNSGNDVVSPSGNHFRFSCSVGAAGNPGLQPYEVAVKVSAVSPSSVDGQQGSIRALGAYLSQRTLGADLASGFHAAAALELVSQPMVAGSLNVHWGPIVCLDIATPPPPVPPSWVLSDPMDSDRYPRKISVGGIMGTVSGLYPRSGIAPGVGPDSDQKEYWAYASVMSPPLIDEAYYISIALKTDVPNPTSANGAPIKRSPLCTGAHQTTCGYFIPGDDIYIFDGTGAGYTLAGGVNSAAIYVDGSAEFQKMNIDGATVIVTGFLTVKNAAGGQARDLHIPVTAASEYPYFPDSPASWPCSASTPGTTCNSAAGNVFPAPGNVQFRGFLFAKKNMKVTAATWNMAGSLLVGDMQALPGNNGTLQIPVNANLNLAYDDTINHSIHVLPVGSIPGVSIRVEPDFIQNIGAF